MVVLIAGTAAWSYFGDGLAATLLSDDLPADQKLAAVKRHFRAWGPWAPAAYILFVTAEVVIAPLPGLMLYAPGGVLFGGFLGGLYSLLGNLIGCAIACQLMRMAGARLIGARFRASLGNLEPLLERRGLWVVFFLRLNPLTSSDLISYAAGLTAMPLWKLIGGTGLGMAPLCWLQAYMAEGVMQAFPGLLYPLLGACLIYMIVVVWTIRRLIRRRGAEAEREPEA